MEKIAYYFKDYVHNIKITNSANIDILGKLIDGQDVLVS